MEEGRKITKLDYQEYLQSTHWQEVRQKRLEIDGYRCRLCGSTQKLNVHHSTYAHCPYNEDVDRDLITLCADCHAKFHDKLDYQCQEKKSAVTEAEARLDLYIKRKTEMDAQRKAQEAKRRAEEEAKRKAEEEARLTKLKKQAEAQEIWSRLKNEQLEKISKAEDLLNEAAQIEAEQIAKSREVFNSIKTIASEYDIPVYIDGDSLVCPSQGKNTEDIYRRANLLFGTTRDSVYCRHEKHLRIPKAGIVLTGWPSPAFVTSIDRIRVRTKTPSSACRRKILLSPFSSE